MLKKIPVALTIAGSDSGGGAGIQADLKTFALFGVHGASAIACLTAQNPARVLAIGACRPKMLRLQLEAVFQEIPPSAIKTGMLFSRRNVSVVADFLKDTQAPLVVDPVMIATSGARLLGSSALKALMEKLLPLATLVTPNVPEAEVLSGRRISAMEDMDDAARRIHSEFGCGVLVKGGHLRSGRATDIFYNGKSPLILSAPFVTGIRTHGTGCVYSAAICAALALGQGLSEAVQTGKKFVTRGIRQSYRIGKHFALGPIS
ncbi:MAG TPA: bifunctional hydroxymethylpyrimidine kinase/phosphomethylpyrimidine kinase [Candidatus Sulfotelmatobacter sp.]|nr:bifunctional hydroxymethylpyrimidine kinase/phosphomethylpyrimidine kinase [Candidatus Sulfotelmatobacter sp.]